jgi:hypothetical protein
VRSVEPKSLVRGGWNLTVGYHLAVIVVASAVFVGTWHMTDPEVEPAIARIGTGVK